MSRSTLISEMMQNIVHIGNKAAFWNPKMRQYLFGSSSWVHVFNLDITAAKLEQVKTELNELSKAWKTILFVSTKVQARETISTIAEATGHPFVADKWVPGILTNFRTIKWRIATYQKLKKDSENGAFDVLTKKEASAKLLELSKLHKAYRGLVNLKRAPDVVFVVDGKFEDQAVREANKLGIKTFGILNTNADPDDFDAFIPANTNSFKSIKFIMETLKADMPFRKVQERTNVRKMAPKKPSGARVAPKATKTEEK